jgi:hypothetical protein
MIVKEVTACPQCGSSNVSSLKHLKYWLERSGAVMGIYNCQDCGYEGFPLVFDSPEDYGKFVRLKKRDEIRRPRRGKQYNKKAD